ncbi:hypothetical protein VOLCADRAFT_74841 [Volvox carteri f. nagariensis]|uniref:Carboxypeptidase n=1 Tax=Volvox carteri f. nagariensis TaxID=3068 RepID=D8TX42_VOLCA|nr:uncharacterized protein VOLCADRAFT_74841 [Volvox carteri f. nagariensis]EFJ47842.1 hypothetical protein VOLCADRAFT_74841 [Volvox carteri f. nagariensis]|eukprot:XP_002950948.1 hypothetical protein VOLCADRAFT_74841 [Volvox carteri f. nagariensis]
MFALRSYITVDEEKGRALFYILAEAPGSAPSSSSSSSATLDATSDASSGTSKPLVLWLNGGPGCSSIGGGFMTELGPFFPLPGGRELQRNPHSWNQFAHMLFVESPAFVGFSYSNSTEDAVVGDARTAADSRIFMLRFLERFPRFSNTPFYVSGESYAGHYVPNLALAIVEGNKVAAASGEPKINLQGFLVGNPWTDAAIDNMGAVDYWWTHALISDQTAQGVRANCNFSRIGTAFDELGSINIYEIYADLCDEPPTSYKMIRMSYYPGDGSNSEYDPCIDDETEDYLNLPEVQRALHANQTVKLPWRWTDCTRSITYSREDLLSSMLPVYERLLQANLRILVYSGDVDGIVPVVGTRRWVTTLRLQEKEAWRPWFSGSQVGGYVVQYAGLTFATVRGAGHMVPYVQPVRAAHMVRAFLAGEPL